MKIVIAGRDFRFADNTKYFFIDSLNCPGVDGSILVKDEALAARINGLLPEPRAFVLGSEAAGKRIEEADWLVVDSNPGRTTGEIILPARTRICQLWHGVGVKAAGLLVKHFTPNSIRHFVGDDLLVATSPALTLIFAKMFRPRRLFVANLPRNRVVKAGACSPLDWIGVDEVARRQLAERKGKAVLYAPTFRSFRAHPELLSPRADVVRKICEKLRQIGAVLFLKLHPLDTLFEEYLRNELATEMTSGRLRIIQCDSDIYPLFREMDMIISDYSSIATDFLFTGKPISIFIDDKESYEELQTACVISPEVFAAGKICKSFGELEESFSAIESESEESREWRGKILQFHFSTPPESAVPEIVHALENFPDGASQRVAESVAIYGNWEDGSQIYNEPVLDFTFLWNLFSNSADARSTRFAVEKMRKTWGKVANKGRGIHCLFRFLFWIHAPIPVLRFYVRCCFRLFVFLSTLKRKLKGQP
ncbi:MAG: CDP-glycerol glycerophosphotransferase family protein [Puniceicoccales bacterium]|jgi:CDP-glycerol glycerophosphotransferase|nr:CDP-glycerol glycerophosphotransferase family protein [Puniceicoccales bacterium]